MDQRPGQLPSRRNDLWMVATLWILVMAQNVSWQRHMKNEDLYAGLKCVSAKISKRKLHLASHSVRHPELGSNPLVLWETTQGTTARGRPSQTYMESVETIHQRVSEFQPWQTRTMMMKPSTPMSWWLLCDHKSTALTTVLGHLQR